MVTNLPEYPCRIWQFHLANHGLHPCKVGLFHEIGGRSPDLPPFARRRSGARQRGPNVPRIHRRKLEMRKE